MNHKDVSQFSPPKFSHYGIVVKDIEKSVKFYEALGIGPFKYQHLHIKDRKIFGKAANDIENKALSAKIGNTGFCVELVQPVAGDSLQQRFLDEHGEGLHHVAFIVEDRNKAIDELKKIGFEVIQTTEHVEGSSSAYLRAGELIIEIGQALNLP